ncbi:MAG: hypothetical protein A3E83_05280 [Gammaproteobacteria bacterium RIFCSPHIGHO2_12_FULL_41_20]|nr:MAG: hypothetical protein A3E83_05280 [Gammaproteobacteria bacterium RIFCSPHIGHO2_12_FULL_41_20]
MSASRPLEQIVASPQGPAEFLIALSFPDSPVSKQLAQQQEAAAIERWLDLEAYLLSMREQHQRHDREERLNRDLVDRLRQIEQQLHDQVHQAQAGGHIPSDKAQHVHELGEKLANLNMSYAAATQQWQQAQQAHAANVVQQLAKAGLTNSHGQPITFSQQQQQQLQKAVASATAVIPKVIQVVSASHQQAAVAPTPVIPAASPLSADTVIKVATVNSEFAALMGMMKMMAGSSASASRDSQGLGILQLLGENKGRIKPSIFGLNTTAQQQVRDLVRINEARAQVRRELAEVMMPPPPSSSTPFRMTLRRGGS